MLFSLLLLSLKGEYGGHDVELIYDAKGVRDEPRISQVPAAGPVKVSLTFSYTQTSLHHTPVLP